MILDEWSATWKLGSSSFSGNPQNASSRITLPLNSAATDRFDGGYPFGHHRSCANRTAVTES
jgi:hypothetical protein